MHALQDYQQRLTDLVHNDASRRRAPITSLPGYDPSFMKEGYLQKKGQRLKGWKRRWFVCDGRSVSYYISRKDRKPNAVIPLESCTVQDGGVSETWNSPRIYITDGTCGVTYCLSAEDGEVVTAWLSVLHTAIARLQRRADRSGGSGSSGETSAAPTLKTLASLADDDDVVVDKSSSRRTAPLVSGDSVVPEKRVARLTSAPVHLNANARALRAKTEHHHTSIAMENDLASGLDRLDALLTNRGASAGAGRHGVVFRPLRAENGVLMSLGTTAAATSSRPRYVARASCILPVASEVAAYIITDHAKRAEWDVQFPRASHVASFDESTELVHLDGGFGFQQLTTTKPFLAPQAAAVLGAVVTGLVSVTVLASDALLVAVVVGGIVGAVVNSVDYSALCLPRDLLVLRYVRETSVLEKRAPSMSDILDADGDENPPVVTILEKSVASELKLPTSGVVRAHVDLSGWLLEPCDAGHTRVTYVTDLDAMGAVSRQTKLEFLLQRLTSVAVLREYVTQSQQSAFDGADVDDDRASLDGDADALKLEEDDGVLLDAYGDDQRSAGGVGSVGPKSSQFHPSVYMKGMSRLPTGGLKLVDKEVAKKQSGVLKDVIKSAGAKMLEGKGTVSLSLPVRIFEPRTNLERLVDLFLFAPTYLNAAAEQSDPLERFKLVMAFAVAGMHHSVGQLKPFNPILGETYQSALNDGTEVCCEHTSHHPPISNFQLVGKKYAICGHVLWHGSFSMKSNAVVQNNRGPIRVSFDDGTVISYHLPVMQSGGFLWGDRTVDLTGAVLFEDRKNRLACELRFNPDEKKGMGGMFSAAKTPSDHFRGVIVNTATDAELCEVSGSWLEELRVGDKAYWVYGRDRSGYTVEVPEQSILTSDSRNREDLQYLAANDLDGAQDWKVRLEVLQRADRKIRNDGRRPNHWTLKDDKASH
ncbi:hypothetical protein PINS_up006147 [Pythium insidiosum]|nr:hypothetical protein PINS_up006147 [Pythium insidiosum]